ncbi:MAG: integration host factor subunit alpha [Caulobacteraceae bacterium]|nr:integration host factor subunit alpha [Caulobacter sp.]
MSLGTLTRADLTEATVRELGLGRQDCADLVERVLALMCGALEQNEAVKLSGFGVFEVRAKTARMGRNPKTGEPAAIVPRRVMTFRASQLLKGRIARAHSARALRAVANG